MLFRTVLQRKRNCISIPLKQLSFFKLGKKAANLFFAEQFLVCFVSAENKP